jgi:hypothetical protein
MTDTYGRITKELTLVAGWNTLPFPIPPGGAVREVYITSQGAITLDVVAVGSNGEDFSDNSVPQDSGYWYVDADVPVGSVGFQDVLDSTDTGSYNGAVVGIKTLAPGTITMTVAGRFAR